VDPRIEFQQNLSAVDLAIVVLTAASNDLDDLRPRLATACDVLTTLQPGQVVRVSA
jgi:hypothetical protein